MFIATYGRTAHLYILEFSTLQCSQVVEEEEESSCPCVECEAPRELLLHRDKLMPPLEINLRGLRRIFMFRFLVTHLLTH